MDNLIKKIKEFVKFSKLQENGKDWSNMTVFMDKQDKYMKELTDMARKNDTLLGRTIGFSVADGQAFYVIDRINDKSVHLTWIDYCDGYCDRHYGERGGSMKMQEALAHTGFEDMIDNMTKGK